MNNDPVVVKGSREGIFVYLDPTLDFEQLKEQLAEKLAASKHFLAGAQIICDFGPREISPEDISAVAKLCSAYNIKIRRVNTSKPLETRDRTVSGRPAGSAQGQGTYPNADDQTLLVKRTLRSGQSISYNGNVVVLGDVNAGAEVIASGNVIVMGALRGVVHAGANGDPDSVVTAIRLKPTQLRIADQITRAPDDDPDGPDVPEIARIKDGFVTIERYIPNERQARVR
ncbi:MAG TPA: septum site-determining protein MinC [Desulfobacteria bacterium]|nr:septum site-determining protein MinC [Desulfobacteria bacterium]